MRKILLLFITGLIFTGCAKMKVQGLADSNYSSNNGILYKLPRTCIAFNITIKTVTYTPGSCFKANINRIPKSVDKEIIDKLDKTGEFSINSVAAIEVATIPVDDPEKYYMIETNTKAFQDRTYGVTLSNQGFMANGNMEVKDNTFDVATQFVSSAASFLNPLALNRAGVTDASVCEQQADSYERLVADRYTFFTQGGKVVGVAPPSPELYQRVMDQFEKAEIEYFSNAFFSTTINKASCIIYFIPSKALAEIKNEKFFTYDAKNDKIVVNEKLPGEIRLQNNGVTAVAISDLLSVKEDKTFRYLSIQPEAVNATVDGRINSISGGTAQGLRYNIPKQCVLSLYKFGELPSVRGTLSLPQWGAVGRLNEKLSKISVALNPETGALLTATLESKGITAEQVKNAVTAASGFRDLFIRDKDAEALAKMEKKIKLLETQDKLGKLQEGEATELIALRKESELLAEKKKVAELKKALKELEQE